MTKVNEPNSPKSRMTKMYLRVFYLQYFHILLLLHEWSLRFLLQSVCRYIYTSFILLLMALRWWLF